MTESIEKPINISPDKKHYYRFLKVYDVDDKENFFIVSTRAKDVSNVIGKLKIKFHGSECKIGKILLDCVYLQVKTGMYSSLEACFERQVLQDNYSTILQNKVEKYII